jgi:hypothetical protein
MTFKIKELVNDKFWIVESNAGKVGTIRRVDSGYEFFDQRNNATQLLDTIEDFDAVDTIVEDTATKTYSGYPTNSATVIPVEHASLLAFKKKDNSKSIYAAGYYILRYHGMGWQHAFCPKIETLEKYEYQGPYLTEWDMNLSLKKARKND